MNPTVSWLTLLSFGDKGWGDELLFGACLSLGIAISAYLVGLALGLVGAVAKISKNRVARATAGAYTTIIRSVPDILIIFLVYYTATDALRWVVSLTGLTSEFQLNGFVAATLSLGIVQGGYSTEVLRGAIIAIPKGQLEAAHALGLTRRQTFFLVTLPQMIPLALPGLGNLWLVVLKESSLVSLIGFTELVLAGKMAAGATHDYFVFYCAIAFVFLVMSGVSAMLFQGLEAATANPGRRK
ncbi:MULTISPECIES: ABC transporter permease [unclassified Mesorhizobium]|uniref:ABC transporter permease n=1 Tax=unclassified Mesorhizobium TaxID=325217 RepID=UPI001CD01E69|nr:MULTISPECIES: ABC transporter permease subunit [unclassified Mesorhizobium]MBZ9743571.1 ABC transporter permease subunit [Mesorhizobium sp. CO1-1-4]MBZ9806232.1 ABC transporter permease subunit [Mesorhizobium sp. ES1-6]